jgi:hypothetical protein
LGYGAEELFAERRALGIVSFPTGAEPELFDPEFA